MSASAACRGFGFAINVEDDPFPRRLFDSLPEAVRHHILEECVDEDGIPVDGTPEGYHISDEFGMDGYKTSVSEKLKEEYPLLSVCIAGDDEDDSPWFIVQVKSTAQSSTGGVPFIADSRDGDEHELQQMDSFIHAYFPSKKAEQLIWSWWVY